MQPIRPKNGSVHYIYYYPHDCKSFGQSAVARQSSCSKPERGKECVMSTTTGREVATGTLWMNKRDNIKVRVRVAARCGTPDCTHQGQLNMYEELYALGVNSGISDKPSRIIALSHISDVCSLNGTHPTTSSGMIPTHSPVFAMSLDGSLPVSESSLWGFMLLLQTGEAVELFAETREQQQQWIQYLNLLSMFPFSPIPEEPRVNPIRDSFRSKLKTSKFDADSVWLVYILAEEVGSRIQALGVHIVTLQSSLSKDNPAKLTIISPVDSEPMVTWEANKMRRTGSLGNMVFIEIGRRCEGGAGLIWMYACPEDSDNFRDTVKRFLFNGDGRSANGTTSVDSTYMYDRVNTINTERLSISSTSSSPSSSGGGSFRLSYTAIPPVLTKESAEYESIDYDYAYTNNNSNAIVERSRSIPYEHVKSSSLPLDSSPPPVNLMSHPSRKKKMHKRSLSNPGTENQLTPAPLTKQHGGSNDSGVASCSTMEEDFQAIDESINLMLNDLSETALKSRNVTKEDKDGLDDVIAQLHDLAGDDDISTQEPVKRSNTLPSGQNHRNIKRANSTSTCQPTHYLKTRSHNSRLSQDDYVIMKPTSRILDQVPEDQIISDSKGKHVPKGKPPRINYDSLEPPIKEPSISNTEGTEYMNHPLPTEIVNAKPIIYQREYENINHSNYIPSSLPNDIDENIYMNHDQSPTTKEEMVTLVSSTWDELDKLQSVLDEFANT